MEVIKTADLGDGITRRVFDKNGTNKTYSLHYAEIKVLRVLMDRYYAETTPPKEG